MDFCIVFDIFDKTLLPHTHAELTGFVSLLVEIIRVKKKSKYHNRITDIEKKCSHERDVKASEGKKSAMRVPRTRD